MLEKEFILTCSCGCGSSIMLNHLDGIIYMDFLSSDFYTRQGTFGNILNRFNLMRGKRDLKELLVSKEELAKLRDYLSSFDSLSSEHVKNKAGIKIVNDDYLPCISLISHLSFAEIMRGKDYRAFNLQVNKRMQRALIQQIDRILK